MITTGPMQLNQPEALDPMEPYFLGTQSGGGLHTDMARLSSHDHSGGLLGAPVAVTIPDGSITAADLDPSVLAPYALTDGSKPFTGQVTMQADAVIRDALHFGEQGTALAPDAHLTRTTAQALTLAGVLTVSPPLTNPALVLNRPETSPAVLWHLTLARAGTPRWHLGLNSAEGLTVFSGDLTQQPVTVTAATGTLTLAPYGGGAALSAAGTVETSVLQNTAAAGALMIQTQGAANVAFNPVGHYVHPSPDNTHALGHSAIRWTTVYAVAGAINTSSREAKEGITPLDPSRAMEAVRNTEAVTFDYIAPTRGPEWYDLPDDPEQAEQVLAQRLTAAPLEAAARHQAGFVSEDADPLFLVGEGQTSPSHTAGILLAALQHMDARLTALEGA